MTAGAETEDSAAPVRPRPRISVLGLGYLGAVHAACLAELGFDVLGVDIDEQRVANLSAGQPPFFEPGLGDLLERGVGSGRLRFSTCYGQAARFGSVHFLCVGTPERGDTGAADLSQLLACVDELGPMLASPCLVVGKSTGPVGTAERLAGRLTRLAPAGAEAEVAWNPEFLREGQAVRDTLRPDRIVIGTQSAKAARVLRQIYAAPIAAGTPLIETSLPTAELVKTAANSFLATKISFINAMAEICEAAGADVLTLAEALGRDPRIGHAALVPGLGFGGSCLPKDIRAFQARAAELGREQALSFLAEVDAINLRCREHAVAMAADLAGGSLRHRAVGVLGAAFKAGSDDVRDSPALDVATAIRRAGASVTVYDPVAAGRASHAHPELVFAASAVGAADGSDVLLVLTDWPEFGESDPEVLGKAAARRNVVDARHVLDRDRWRAAGWRYRAPGRPYV